MPNTEPGGLCVVPSIHDMKASVLLRYFCNKLFCCNSVNIHLQRHLVICIVHRRLSLARGIRHDSRLLGKEQGINQRCFHLSGFPFFCREFTLCVRTISAKPRQISSFFHVARKRINQDEAPSWNLNKSPYLLYPKGHTAIRERSLCTDVVMRQYQIDEDRNHQAKIRFRMRQQGKQTHLLLK